MLALAHQRIKDHPERYIDHVYGEHENGGTSTFYISPVPFDLLGFPVTDCEESPAHFNRFHMHDLHAATRPTVLFGLLGYSSVLVILFFDLGRWDRFWHFLVYPNINSALFEVSWCIALYSTILIFEFSPVLLENSKHTKLLATIKKYTLPMVIAGVTLSSMHQSSLGSLFVIMSPRLHPLWYSLLLPVFFLVSSLAAGIALVLIGSTASYWFFHCTLKQRQIEKLGWFLPWILGFYLALRLGELLLAEEFGLLFRSGKYSVLFLVELVVGVVLPMILFSIKKLRLSRTGSLVGALIVVAGIYPRISLLSCLRRSGARISATITSHGAATTSRGRPTVSAIENPCWKLAIRVRSFSRAHSSFNLAYGRLLSNRVRKRLYAPQLLSPPASPNNPSRTSTSAVHTRGGRAGRFLDRSAAGYWRAGDVLLPSSPG